VNMKRDLLIKTVTSGGAVFVRHGGRHDWYKNIQTGMQQQTIRFQGGEVKLEKISYKKKNSLNCFII